MVGRKSGREFVVPARFVEEEDEEAEEDEEGLRPTIEGIRFDMPAIAPPAAAEEAEGEGDGSGEAEAEGTADVDGAEGGEEEDTAPDPEDFAVELSFNGQQFSADGVCVKVFFGEVVPDEAE